MKRAFHRVADRAARVLRVSAYFAVVLAVCGVLAAGRARAAAGDAVLALGGELAGMGDRLGPANRVRLNGELVNVASAMVDEAPGVVLDRFEGECRAHAGGMAEELARIPEASRAALPTELRGSAGLGIVRKDDGDRGAIACLARDGDEGTAGTLRGLREMIASGDLSKLGKLRYVVAERARGATKTHVVGVWTDGPLRFRAFVPKDGGDGDAPGSDAPDAPRPDRARRLLTASLEGVPYSLRIYDAPSAAGEVLAGYDRDAPGRGWQALPAVARELEAKGRAGRAFTREGVDLMIFAEADRRDPTRAIVSVVEMSPPAR
jgi:hypothetical protein